MYPWFWIALHIILKSVQKSATGGLPVIGETDPFFQAATTQQRVCFRHRSCLDYMANNQSTTVKCCGFCTCDIFCAIHGSCCLDAYANFTHGSDSVRNSRYDCILAQYLPPKDTDLSTNVLYWMVAKCDPNFYDINITAKCNQPGLQVESVVPVTDPVTGTHFKNQHCAHCNWLAVNYPLIYWKLQINSKQMLSFPNNDLLRILKESRGNIYFRPQKYIWTLGCDPVPAYTIDYCNQTGLWKEYNTTIELACNSFVDPFNYTYKNYFCYLCNTRSPETPDDWNCPYRILLEEIIQPQFSAVLDVKQVISKENQETLLCDEKQFEDSKMMKCRDVLCYDHRVLENGECRPDSIIFSKKCFSVFVKLTPLTGEKTQKLSTLDKDLLKGIVKFHFRVPNSETGRTERAANSAQEDAQRFMFFFKTNAKGLLKYIIVYTETEFDSSLKKNRYLDTLMHYRFLGLDYDWEQVMTVSVELSVFNISTLGQNAKIYVPDSNSMHFDELISESEEDVGDFCFHRKTIFLNKLHWCPYIELGSGELSMTVKTDYLYFPETIGGNDFQKTLPKWEYEIYSEKIKICLQDYLDVYEVMIKAKSEILVTTNEAVCLNPILHVLIIYLLG